MRGVAWRVVCAWRGAACLGLRSAQAAIYTEGRVVTSTRRAKAISYEQYTHLRLYLHSSTEDVPTQFESWSWLATFQHRLYLHTRCSSHPRATFQQRLCLHTRCSSHPLGHALHTSEEEVYFVC